MLHPTRVLVVEDSATQAMALCAILEEQHFTVVRAASGAEALAELEKEPFDLVLSDIVMPGMTGYELCRTIKSNPELAALPVVLLTSLGDPLDIVRGLECGADNYVTKPFDPKYLCARIRHVLDRQRLRSRPKASLGVSVSFLGTSFSITSDKEQILDLFISSVEEVVRSNRALQESQRELAAAQSRLEEFARGMSRKAQLSADKYATLMHQASDAIAVLDPDGRILETNVRATELFGLSAQELEGRFLAEFVVEQSSAQLVDELRRLAQCPRVEAELSFHQNSGSVAICSFSASRTRSPEGDLVLVILHDVTSIKDAADRVEKSRRQLVQAQRLAKLGSWERDLGSDEIVLSPETCRILGLPDAQTRICREDVVARVDPADRATVRRAMDTAAARGVPVDVEVRIRHPDGAVRVLQAHTEPVRDESNKAIGLLGTVQDITEQRELTEQLHQAQKMEAVGQLAGGVAHDFNNLLTVITSYCGLLLSGLPPADPAREDITEIDEAARRAAALTRQLLTFSRRQVLQPQAVNVETLTTQLEKMLSRLVREDIRILKQFEAGDALVWADPGQVEQVLMNLVVNARDAMPNGGIIMIRTGLADRPTDLKQGESYSASTRKCLKLEVIDTGTGMPPGVLSRIFEPFFTTKEQGIGTGLGLSTVYGIVHQSGGEIDVESRPGMGTTFRIHLPLHTSSSDEAPVSVASDAPQHSGGETVLLVEDDAALRAVACRMLRSRGYVVLEASGGRQALEICARHPGAVDLVVTDMVMPDMSGLELIELVAQRYPEVRLLCMSGYSQDSRLSDGVAHERLAFLEKPFTPAEFGAKVRQVLDAKRLPWMPAMRAAVRAR